MQKYVAFSSIFGAASVKNDISAYAWQSGISV